MPNLVNGSLQLLIFSIFLILVLKFEQKYFKFYPGVKWSLASGFFLLFNATLLGNFIPLTGVSNSNFRAGIEISLYLLGSILILIGLKKWFSHLSRAKVASARRLKRLSCLKNLQSIPWSSQDLEINLKEAFKKLMQFMGYKKGALYWSALNSPEIFLLSHFGFTPEELQRFYRLDLNEAFYSETLKTKEVLSLNQFKGTPEWKKLFQNKEEICSFACIPLKNSSRVLGLIFIYDSEPERFVFEEIQFLNSLKDALGMTIEGSCLLEKMKTRKKELETIDKLGRLFLESQNIEEDFLSLAQNLKNLLEFDYLSLSLVEGSGKNVKKFSLGLGENVLLDKTPNQPAYGTSDGWVIDSGEVFIESDLEKEGLYEDNLSKLLRIRSKIVLPLKIKQKVVGTLGLGSKKPSLYKAESAKRINLLSSLFSLYLQKKNLKESLSQEHRYFQVFSRRFLEFLKHRDLQEYLDKLAEDLTYVLPVSFCRISFLEPGENTLENFSSYKRREEICFSAQNSQPLDALPWHRLTLETKRPMLINQDDPESTISKDEADLFLAPNLKSALLLPILYKEQSLGLITLGEMRSWERRPYKGKEIDFLEKISEQVSLARKESLDQGLANPEHKSYLTQKIFGLGLELNNSLTSIIGSLELLNLRKNLTEEKTERYLKIIEKGALRIKENMERFFSQTDSVPMKK